jgi:hypothetical protein
MCISRAEFEEVFGPLANLMPKELHRRVSIGGQEDHVEHHFVAASRAVLSAVRVSHMLGQPAGSSPLGSLV